MLHSQIIITTLFFYLLGTMFQASVFVCPAKQLRGWAIGLGLIAVCCHAILLHLWIDVRHEQNLSFLNLFSLMTWLIAVFVLVIAIRKKIELLMLIIFPLNALSIILIKLFPAQSIINTLSNSDNLFHILLSVFMLCVLCFAGLCAVLLSLQEYCLRNKKCSILMAKLPALESMEILLSQSISLGFILLSAVLVTSLYFYHDIMISQHLVLKTILTTCSWLVLTLLLVGRFSQKIMIFGTYLSIFLLIAAVVLKN